MKHKAPQPSQRPLPQRERERVLLGLDEAFAITTSVTTPSTAAASNAATATAAAAAARPSSSSLLAASGTRQGLYEELPARFLVVQTEPNDGPTTATTLEATLQDLLLRNKSGDTAEARLRGKTVQLDNTRGQTEQQKQETRLRQQLLRGGRGRATTRRFALRIAEEEGGGKGKQNEKGEDRAMGRKKKRGAGPKEEENKVEGGDEPVAGYSALEANWQSYMQGVLLAAGGSGAATTASTSTTNVYTTKHLALQKAVVTADLHGCPLEVVVSKCASEVGLKGTVLRESAGAFHLLLLQDKKGKGQKKRRGGVMKIVPKSGRRFEALFMMGEGKGKGKGEEGDEGSACYRVVLHGNGLVDRARAFANPLLRKRRQGGGGGGGVGDVNERLLRNTTLTK